MMDYVRIFIFIQSYVLVVYYYTIFMFIWDDIALELKSENIGEFMLNYVLFDTIG